MTSQFDSSSSTPPVWWDELARPRSRGVALVSTAEPRIVAANPTFARMIGRPPSALCGLSLSEIELGNPFLATVRAWQWHVGNVAQCESVSWPTWLNVGDGGSLRALMALNVQPVEGVHVLVMECVELAPDGMALDTERDPDLASLDAIPVAACRLSRDGRLLSSNALATEFLEFHFEPLRGAYSRTLPARAISSSGEAVRGSDLPWMRALSGFAGPHGPLTLGFNPGSYPGSDPGGDPGGDPGLGLGSEAGAGEPPAREVSSGHAPSTTRWALVCAASEPATDALRSTALVTLVDVTTDKLTTDALRESDRKLRRMLSSVNNLQDQLARSEHMASLGMMAAGVAHEINNPLSYILSNLSFAAERAIDQETRLALREALEGASRMRDIVRDLRTLSRMESEEEPQPIDVRNAVDAALKLSLDEVRQRARLQRHFETVPRVLGDETRLVQVLLNLVTNAAHSIVDGLPSENQITVELKTVGEEVAIFVRDTGAGISPEHLPKVFEPFFTTKPAGQGTGLGLSICHRLIDGMGGRIEVESEEGRGTCFVVFLKATHEMSDVEGPPSEMVPSSRRLRLLVVDDEILVARAVQRMFKTQFVVEIALGGEEALEKLSASHFDIVLCDVMMPRLSGLEVFRRVRAQNPSLARRFVFATGGLFSQELSSQVKRLSNVIVEKPFEPEELRRVIEAAAVPRLHAAAAAVPVPGPQRGP